MDDADYTQAQAELAEAMQAKAAERRQAPKGEPNCTEATCGAPISQLRQDLGATRCVDCQQLFERTLRRYRA